MHMRAYLCVHSFYFLSVSHAHTSWITLDPTSVTRKKIIYISESALSYKKNSQALFTWGQDGLQNHADDDTMKNINYHKNISPPCSCPWRCMREPDSERRKERRRKGRAKKVERDRKEEKEKEMEKKKLPVRLWKQ